MGEFLAKFPQFRFDFEEYLLSTRHMDWLNERFGHFEAYLTGVETYRMSEDTIVRAIRDHLAKAVPAYSSLASIRALSDIPLMDKTDLRRNLASYINTLSKGSRLWSKDTSGSTGAPVTIFYSPAFYFEYAFLTLRRLTAVTRAPYEGCRPVFSLVTNEWSQVLAPQLLVDPTRRVGLTVTAKIDDRNPMTIDYFVHLVRKLRPRFVMTTVTILEILLTQAPGRWLISEYRPECVFTAGAVLDEDLRAHAQELFGAPVFDCYGMVEFGAIGYECTEQSGFHIDETSVCVEIIGSNGRPAEEGEEGEIVVSSVLNEVMPLLRYRTGDRGALVTRTCRCGAPGPRIKRLSGSRAFCFRFGHPSVVSIAHFNALPGLFPIVEFQVTQPTQTRLDIVIQPDDGVSDVGQLLNAIRCHVAAFLPSGVEVRMEAITFDCDTAFTRYRTFVTRPACYG